MNGLQCQQFVPYIFTFPSQDTPELWAIETVFMWLIAGVTAEGKKRMWTAGQFLKCLLKRDPCYL